MDIAPFLAKLSRVVINPLLYLVFAVAFLVFFWGIFQFINSEAAADERNEGKKKIMYGLIGMFIMFSAYGLVGLVLKTFGIEKETPAYLQGKINPK